MVSQCDGGIAERSDPAAKQFVEHLPSKLPGIWIHPTAYVHPQARVIGPAFIGAGTKVLADAVVIGPAVIGENCEISSDAVVHESILWNGSQVGSGGDGGAGGGGRQGGRGAGC